VPPHKDKKEFEKPSQPIKLQEKNKKAPPIGSAFTICEHN